MNRAVDARMSTCIARSLSIHRGNRIAYREIGGKKMELEENRKFSLKQHEDFETMANESEWIVQDSNDSDLRGST